MDKGFDQGSKSLISVKDGGEIVALNCPNCGAGVHFGQGGCGHCGSGLMRKVGEGPKRFNMPNDAKEFKRDETTKNLELPSLLKHMASSFSNPEDCAYVMWRGAPAFVGKGVNVDEAIENWQETRKTMEREELGSKWTDAVAKFGSLLRDMEQMPTESRIDAGSQYIRSFGEDRLIDLEPIDNFFRRPNFNDFEEMIQNLPGGRDDADLLNKGVSKVRAFIPSQATS